MRLEQLLFSHAERTPERIAVVAGHRKISYQELARSVRAIANGLKRSVRPGDRVAIHLPNGIEFVQLFYATLAAGASVVPINPRLAPPEIEHILADAKPALLLDAVKQFQSGKAEAAEPQSNEECVILYTSGTTGKPKGAMGYKVYSKELEQVLMQHPGIEDAAVVGVPDATYGEAVVAVIQPRAGQKLLAEDVVERCRGRLAGYKKPRRVVFVDALPRNSVGKVVKRELRIRIEAAPCPRPDR